MITYPMLLRTYDGFTELLDLIVCSNCEWTGLVVPGLSRCPECKKRGVLDGKAEGRS